MGYDCCFVPTASRCMNSRACAICRGRLIRGGCILIAQHFSICMRHNLAGIMPSMPSMGLSLSHMWHAWQNARLQKSSSWPVPFWRMPAATTQAIVYLTCTSREGGHIPHLHTRNAATAMMDRGCTDGKEAVPTVGHAANCLHHQWYVH